jgi:hypothetical protein
MTQDLAISQDIANAPTDYAVSAASLTPNRLPDTPLASSFDNDSTTSSGLKYVSTFQNTPSPPSIHSYKLSGYACNSLPSLKGSIATTHRYCRTICKEEHLYEHRDGWTKHEKEHEQEHENTYVCKGIVDWSVVGQV